MSTQEPKAPAIKPCPECGGERIFTRLRGDDHEVDLVPVHTKLFDMRRTNVRALTCLVCGYTTFYATAPDDLK